MPEKKKPGPPSPRIYTNSEGNLLKSIERLARWTLKGDVTPDQVQKVRASTGLLRLRVELARLELDRKKWEKELEIEARLERIEDALAEK